MEAVAAIFGLLFLLFVAAGVFVTVKAVKAAKRGVDRGVAQARRTVEDTTLRARQLAQPGVAGELAQLRLSLRTSMRATQDVLHAGAAEDASLSEALGLFERLSAHGHELDDELKRLEREPDRASVASRLPELRERLERITHSAESLRWAARDRARQFADDDLATLGEQIDMEAGALRHWAKEPLEDRLQASGEAPGTAAGGAGAAASGAAASGTAASAGSAGSTAGRKSWEPAEDETPALTARDPRTQPTYPWQKAPRKERTT
ncbi:hypothetical protein ACH4FX_09160 [Streptomyces sp. NPDC018019]|uniref:hypothetical protein n=1 Tax=Streptomyces sp. NPDC018019 TaxID=3365030 RepID=UPI0037920BAE